MENLFGENIEELEKQEKAEEEARKKAEAEKKKLEAEQKKAEQEALKKEKEEKVSYTFTTIGDVKTEILKALKEIAETDPQFKTKFDETKMDVCYNWLIEQIKKAYTKANGNKNGGVDISNEQCIAACKHFYNEELWKYYDTPKEESKKKETVKKEKEPEQMSLDFDFNDDEDTKEQEQEDTEDYSQFDEEQEQEEEPEEE